MFPLSIKSCFGWLIGLEFNGPVKTIKVMLSQSVYLTILFLDMLSPLIFAETDNSPS